MHTYKSTAFVIMPFAAHYASGFEDIIKPAARLAGVDCIRADQDALGHIHTRMFERLFDSPVVIADISGANPNVFYELGVVHSLATKTITMAREDYIGQVPFDIAPYRVLIYPKPPSQPADESEQAAYRAKVEAAIQQLSSELLKVARHGEAIPNPVQDFICGRSPLTSVESQFLDALGENFERDLLRHAHSRVIHAGLTGAHFTTVLTGYVESETRTTPLSVHVLLLDPVDTKGWEFVYILREGRDAQQAGIRDFIEENRFMIGKTKRTIERLNERYPWFTGHVSYYSGVPLFWAYMIDESRVFVGHLALNRISSLNLPVYVFVKEDRKTTAMFHYYASTIKSLSGEHV
jgi:hypothetical protein